MGDESGIWRVPAHAIDQFYPQVRFKTMLDLNLYLKHLEALHTRHWPENVPRTPEYPFGRIPLTEYLKRRALLHPHKPAIIFYGRELSFAELDDLSERFAHLLRARGVGAGARVAVFLPNCPQFLIAFYGILKLGAIHVPVNPLFKSAEVLHELRDSGATVLLALDQLLGVVEEVRQEAGLTHVFATGFGEMLPDNPDLPLPPALLKAKHIDGKVEDLLPALSSVVVAEALPMAQLDTPAALNYTGGTTGLPKGCVHTQWDMVYTAATLATVALGLQDADVGIGVNPVFWIGGETTLVIQPVFSGVTVVMLARWDPVAWMRAVEKYKVTFAGLVLDSVVEVMDHPDVMRYDFSSLRSMRGTSFVKKLGVSYRQRWRALTGVTIAEAGWGMTETHTFDAFTRGMQRDDFDLKSQPIFVGFPVPGTEFKICDFESGELLPLGAEGELCCRSPSMLKRYWNFSGEAEPLRDGWLYTGDVGLLDQLGYLHFLGRRKEMLKVKGMSVFPTEIEALLGLHPSVIGSAVLGRADASKGEVPVAFVCVEPTHRGQLTAAALEQWCRERMASYKVPEIRFVEALPTSATGKVLKRELVQYL